MRVGIPTEIKADEHRVAITPAGVTALVSHGHDVLVQEGAGLGSHIRDAAYRDAGATLVADAREVWERGELVLKVKEPLPPDSPLWASPNFVVTPHVSADDGDSYVPITLQLFFDNLERYLDGVEALIETWAEQHGA